MATNNQKFSFLAPDAADFRKKMRVFAILFVLLVVLFIGSLTIQLDDSPVISAFKAIRAGLFGGLIGGAYASWQAFKNRQLLAKSGHIEIDSDVLRIVAEKSGAFFVESRDIEKIEERNDYLLVFYRDQGKLKNKSIYLVDVDRADDFVAAVKELIAAAK